MERLGVDFNDTGSVMTRSELEEQRRKRGECLTCGRKCFNKKLFKMIPITEHGKVLNGRCLNCRPLEVMSENTVLPAVSRPATREDMERFRHSQRNLASLQYASGRTPTMRRTSNPREEVPTTAMSRRVSNQREDVRREGAMARRISNQREEVLPMGGPLGGSLSGPMGSLTGPMGGPMSGPMSRRISNQREEVLPVGVMGRRGSNEREPVGPPRIMRRSSNQREEVTPYSAGPQPSAYMTSQAQSGRTFRTSSSMGVDSIDESRQASYVQSARSLGTSINSAPQRTTQTAPISVQGPGQILDNGATSAINPGGIMGTAEGAYAAQLTSQRIRERQLAKPNGHAAANRILEDPEHSHYPQQSVNSDGMDGFKPLAQSESARGNPQLDRGGIVNLDEIDEHETTADESNPPTGMPAESSRTLSSMSSLEEENERRSRRTPRGAPIHPPQPGLHYNEDESYNVSSGGDRAESGLGVLSPESEEVHQAIQSLRDPGSNYEAVLLVLQQHKTSALAQEEAFKALSDLHLSPGEQDIFSELGGLQSVVEGMTAHMMSAGVQASGCRALWNLSVSTENQLRIGEVGGIEAIVAAMGAFEGNAEVQEKAMAALSNVGAASTNQQHVSEVGGIQKIVEAMTRHSENVKVQAMGCAALTNLASKDPSVKAAITSAGGADAIVISMVMHPRDVDVQQKALRALRNLCANEDENKILVATVGGIDSVIGAMQVHRDDAGVQEAGAWTLSNLAVNAENKALIGESGGIDVIVRAMWVHSENVGVQEWACRALWTLSVDPNNKDIVVEVGGISAVVNAMQAHVDAATVQEKGCGVLSNLAANDDGNKAKIVEEEALDAIVMAMVIHTDNKVVQDRACTVLRKLAFGPNLKPMQAANVASLMQAAADKYPDQCGEKARYVISLL